jgi:hypothetical protein
MMKTGFFGKGRRFAACGVLLAAALIVLGCDDGSGEKTLEEAASDAVVDFRVNSAGNGFTNVGTGADGFTFTATNQGGSFETIGGHKVFNTGGVDAGTTSGIPWTGDPPSASWMNYKDIGYVDLGAATGDYLCTLENWSIETYIQMPSDGQVDRIGQFVWGFSDKEAPDNAVWFGHRHFQLMIKIAGQEPVDENLGIYDGTPEATAGGGEWNVISALHQQGTWHQMVTTKTPTKVTTYLDGVQIFSAASTKKTTDIEAGTLTKNYLGKSLYPEGVWDQSLFKTKYYKFAIYDTALTANEVQSLYIGGPIGKGQLQ